MAAPPPAPEGGGAPVALPSRAAPAEPPAALAAATPKPGGGLPSGPVASGAACPAPPRERAEAVGVGPPRKRLP
eukprot:2289354-Alexandrium_andersonii.AAC.1